jgi:D-3-phosphoglycerate dehydrogenase / 2-oxoglutarate reductase
MPTVVIAYDLSGEISIEQKVLSTLDGVNIVNTGNLVTPEAIEAASKADALMVTIQDVTADIIAKLERCRIISRVGTGLDAINIPAATERGIWVTSVPDYSVDEVATHAITLLLVHARSLTDLLTAVHEGRWWDPARVRPVQRLKGQMLGLVGYGRIGQAMSVKARGLGLNVIAYDPYLKADALQTDGVQLADFETLLRTSDYISLHAPLTETTRHIINADALAQMKPTSYLINTARGPLVDEEALLQAVRSGHIAGAAIDVFAVEPPPADHPFLHEPRITITPHAGWYSEQSKVDVRYKGAEEVVRVLRGEKPRSPVNSV